MTDHTNDPTEGDIQGNWDKLVSLVDVIIPLPYKQEHLELMLELRDDVTIEGKHYLGFKRAPAAKGNHHNFDGGLAYHLLEMWKCWGLLRPTFYVTDYVDDERIFKAILYHDIHKAYRTFYVLNAEQRAKDPHHKDNKTDWAVDYGKDLSDTLLTHDIKGLWLLMKHNIQLDLPQMNAYVLSHGGYSEIRPKEQSVLAKVAYLLDEMSGNGLGRIGKRTLLELRNPVD